MSHELNTELGVFIIYNRNTDSNPEIELLGDEWSGNGFWHFGEKEGAQFRMGYESAEEAQAALENYVWASVEGYGWTS
jgi:hypothetical protein